VTVTITPVHRWYCPNCPAESVTHEAKPHTRFHECPGLMGLTAPMIEVGQKVQVTAVEREDYIGNENVGRVMAVKTERSDGSNDVAVFAPTATAKAEEL
jgi:hypothetical protein